MDGFHDNGLAESYKWNTVDGFWIVDDATFAHGCDRNYLELRIHLRLDFSEFFRFDWAQSIVSLTANFDCRLLNRTNSFGSALIESFPGISYFHIVSCEIKSKRRCERVPGATEC